MCMKLYMPDTVLNTLNESCLKHFSFHFAPGGASLRSGFEEVSWEESERPEDSRALGKV